MAQPAFEPQMMSALDSDDPVGALRDVAQSLLRKGVSRPAVTARLEQLRAVLREAGRDQEEDTVLDVLDFVAGWTSPHMKI